MSGYSDHTNTGNSNLQKELKGCVYFYRFFIFCTAEVAQNRRAKMPDFHPNIQGLRLIVNRSSGVPQQAVEGT